MSSILTRACTRENVRLLIKTVINDSNKVCVRRKIIVDELAVGIHHYNKHGVIIL